MFIKGLSAHWFGWGGLIDSSGKVAWKYYILYRKSVADLTKVLTAAQGHGQWGGDHKIEPLGARPNCTRGIRHHASQWLLPKSMAHCEKNITLLLNIQKPVKKQVTSNDEESIISCGNE